MPAPTLKREDYQNIFHWAETQKEGTIPSFAVRKNDPYEVSIFIYIAFNYYADMVSVPSRLWKSVSDFSRADLFHTNQTHSFESEAVPGTIPQGQNSPRCVRFGLYAEQMTASAFVAPRPSNKNAWLYRVRPAVAHEGFVSWVLC